MRIAQAQQGFTLVEVLVGILVSAIIISAFVSVLNSGVALLTKIEHRSSALALANQQAEYISNLDYDAVGTVGGVPSGDIPQTQVTEYKDDSYTIQTRIEYIDDAYDGLIPDDTVNVDYKRVQVTVTWENNGNSERVRLVRHIVPPGLESLTSGGTLWIEVFDPTTDPIENVQNATVQIEAPDVSPPVSVTTTTDENGRVLLPGAPVGIEAYAVTVTKSGYSSAQTYDRDPIANPNPQPAHLNILDGQVTKHFFQISQLVPELLIRFQTDDDKVTLCHFQNGEGNTVTVSINSVETHFTEHGDYLGPCVGDYDATKNPLDIDFTIHGTKIIGTDGDGAPIYKFYQEESTGSDGEFTYNDLDPDAYSIDVDEAAIGYVVTGYSHPLPLIAKSGVSYAVTIDLAAYSPYTALVSIFDSNGDPVTDATVSLEPTSGPTKSAISYQYGQVFFDSLDNDSYILTVTHADFADYSDTVQIDGNERIQITLASNL